MKYTFKHDNGFTYESDDLEDFNKRVKELKIRRTGRTTQMLFRALGDPSKNIVIVSFNSAHSKMLLEQVGSILEKLKFDFKVNKTDLSLTNLGRTFYFRSSDFMSENPKSPLIKFPTYVDQK